MWINLWICNTLGTINIILLKMKATWRESNIWRPNEQWLIVNFKLVKFNMFDIFSCLSKDMVVDILDRTFISRDVLLTFFVNGGIILTRTFGLTHTKKIKSKIFKFIQHDSQLSEVVGHMLRSPWFKVLASTCARNQHEKIDSLYRSKCHEHYPSIKCFKEW